MDDDCFWALSFEVGVCGIEIGDCLWKVMLEVFLCVAWLSFHCRVSVGHLWISGCGVFGWRLTGNVNKADYRLCDIRVPPKIIIYHVCVWPNSKTLFVLTCSSYQIIWWRSPKDVTVIKENYYVLLTSSIRLIQKPNILQSELKVIRILFLFCHFCICSCPMSFASSYAIFILMFLDEHCFTAWTLRFQFKISPTARILLPLLWH